MTPLMKFFGWFDIIIATLLFISATKGVKWIIGKLKKQPQEGEIETPLM